MEPAEGSVGLHLMDDIVDQCQQVVLSFAHQDAYLRVGEGLVQQWRCQACVVLHML